MTYDDVCLLYTAMLRVKVTPVTPLPPRPLSNIYVMSFSLPQEQGEVNQRIIESCSLK